MKKIIVFGATGDTGKQVVEQGLLAGYQVTAIVRNPDALVLKHPLLKIIKGDVFQPTTFEEALRGQDVVVSCLGIQKRRPTTVYSEGLGNIIKGMTKENIHRLICISAGAVVVPPKSSFVIRFVTKNILQRIFKYVYSDMLIMEKIVAESNLDWTIIRAPWLRDTKLTGIYRTAVNEHLQNPSKISRADLAHYIIHHLNDEKPFKSLVQISY
jgi:putative NADH-flavin reductase